MRQSSSFSDVRSQGVGSSIGYIYSYSSVHGGVEGESAQRCKARLERHRRTAERAAKALAEKNTRDLLAQREQAERNRLAEALDAEVKRWSSGKEANLRALLSTLQYILGPDSGWQPIPLTEVITSAAVKKAYRKATLCVHPDKLQQRGASVQQKYICEKVFDLLKEAWNRFNSEEQ
ncbi:auxilin-related protein 1-like [Camellia sinensis]|uniref:auxilin-related protein 1-like n=1 Tax=Camellia sinensis TaxID=4442 RepID=UPI00103657CF|nr:auxilin-related protein 1-like [Camellia sinensis]